MRAAARPAAGRPCSHWPPFPPQAAAHRSSGQRRIRCPSGLYRDCLHRLRLLERYPGPDWSIADLWVARELLRTGTPLADVAAVLRGSPDFPRHHADPEDYLQRTLSRAAL